VIESALKGLPRGPAEAGMEFTNAFTVDVEEHFQVSAFEKAVDRRRWDEFPSRVVANTRRMLELLDRYSVRGTFFVLAWVAERNQKLVREIEAAGHEIASHGYWHRIVYGQTPEEFRADIRRGRDVLQDIVGHRITAYRAPSFSITRRSTWAIEILAEEGFEIDSSIFPIYHDRYGIPDAPLEPHRIDTRSGPLWEFPPSVAQVAGLRVPVGGGGYFRIYPFALSAALLRRIHRRDRRSFMFYIHPWEIDPEQPRVAVNSRLSRFRHYFNLRGTEARLAKLFERFRFAPVGEIIGEQIEAASTKSASTAESDVRSCEPANDGV
jgi:polysaccharide deacetylase family protein (PEP-CTERM system associated)